jgi:alpha-L-rhamnosidase
MQRFATVTNQTQDISEYATLAQKIKEGFNKKFFNAEKQQYSNNTVTANLLPLYFGMVPDNYKEAVFKNIVQKTMVENGGHISTGVIGTQWLMRGFTNYGRPDVAYTIATKRDYPSWGYMADHGATTIWELWNGNTADPAMNSGNHVMLLGDLIVWYYENLAGIKSNENQPGYKQIEMKPSFVEGLNFVNASYHSIHGLIKSEWKKTADQFSWNISIPANTKAVVYLPAASVNDVAEGGKNISTVDGIRFLRTEGDRTVVEIGSGNYSFTTKGKERFREQAVKP